MRTSNTVREPSPADPIEVWCLPLVGPTCRTSEWGRALTSEEEAQLRRIVSSTRRQRIRAAWGARRTILAHTLHCEPGEVAIRRRPRGAPAVDALGQPLHISLSHSGDWMLFAISRTHRVGVDIERVDPEADALRLARRFFRADEAVWLSMLPPEKQSQAFFHVWSRKEALLKAMGGGVPSRLRSVQPGPEETLEPVLADGISWTVRDLAAPESYVASLAASAATNAAVVVHGAI